MTARQMNTNRGQSPTSRFLNGVVPVCIVCSYLWLATCGDLRLAVPELLGATALVCCLLIIVLGAGQRGLLRWSPLFILLVALLCRLPFWWQPPQLSDDLYRYLWDGLQILHGNNPYALPPAAMAATGGALLGRINHPQLVTIYPPMAQWIFAGGALWGGGVLGLKLFLGLIDMVVCGLILLLLRRVQQPCWLAVLYAWQPLPILEIAGSGHIDGAAIALLLVSLWLLLSLSDRPLAGWLSGAAFSAAVLVKLFPLVFLPVWWWALTRRQRFPFVLAGVISTLLLSWPFWPQLTNAWATLRLYAANWEFSGFLFRLVREAGLGGGASRLLLGGLFLVCLALIQVVLWRQRMNAGTVAQPLFGACYQTAFCFLLLTTTLHPWYALYLAMFLPFAAGPAGLVLSWSVLLAYRVLIPYGLLGVWQESTWWSGVIWLSALIAFGMVFIIRFRDRASDASLAPGLPSNDP